MTRIEGKGPRNLKVRQVRENTDIGVYVWELPGGSYFSDGDGNFLSIASREYDLNKIKNITDAARHYGQPEGKAVFLAGAGKVSDAEYAEDLERMNEGLTPYGDVGAWRDEANARKRGL
jgi:hypothetical protein